MWEMYTEVASLENEKIHGTFTHIQEGLSGRGSGNKVSIRLLFPYKVRKI
jgi:hypothetical protein